MSQFRFVLAALLLSGLLACADQTVERTTRAASGPAAAEPAADDDPAAEETPAPAPTTTTPPKTTPPAPGGPAPAPGGSACTTTFGHSITAQYGRLDGVVRAVVLPGDTSCASDDDHVIVQIDVDGETYATWVNVESNVQETDPQIRFAQLRAPLQLGAWSEGWHPAIGQLDYAFTLNVHTSSFAPMSKAAAATQIAQLVKKGAQVSAFVDGFATADGGHKVHRNGYGKDGALVVIEPSGAPRWLLFHFSQQLF